MTLERKCANLVRRNPLCHQNFWNLPVGLAGYLPVEFLQYVMKNWPHYGLYTLHISALVS